MMNTDSKKSMIVDSDSDIIASLLIQMNGFVSIGVAEKLTTLDKTTQYRERINNRFPTPENITFKGRRKAYRIQDLKRWLENPTTYSPE